jgi:polysaccharide pyruvyl transferase WcaK-like protein
MIAGDLHNLGDLALLLVNLDHARREGRPALVRQWGSVPKAIARQAEAGGGKIVDGRAPGAMLRLGLGSDMLIGGGQIVRQNTSLRALTYLAMLTLAVRLGGGRIETRGLGISETSGLRRILWRFVLARCESLNLRDRQSFGRAAILAPRVQARLTADMVLAGDLPARAVRRSVAGPSIVVAICEDASESRSVPAGALQALLAAAKARWPGIPVRAAIHDLRPGADRDFLMRALGDDHDVLIDDGGGDLGELLATYRDAVIVITNRLHSGLFATVFDRPVAVLDDGNDKLRVLYEQLGAARIDLRVPTEADAAAALDNALGGAERRGDAVQRLRQAARNNLFGDRECAIFNVKFSPNLGDGLIAECLESALHAARPELAPKSIDLAGRTRYDPATGRNRRRLLGALDVLPTRVRATLMPILLTVYARTRLRPKWRRQLMTSDSAVIGGGALLADADQNFPVKLSHVLRLCAELNRPVAIAHVGVTPGWSEGGRTRFLDALRQVRLLKISVRDRQSLTHFRTEFGNIGPTPQLALDPGLLCRDTYGPVVRGEGPTRIGLCLTEPLVLDLHGEGGVDMTRYRPWLAAVIERLAQRPGELLLFTNGSPEDEQFASELFRSVDSCAAVRLVPRHTRPAELARFIAGLDIVVAHRLHACIAAYSYRVPAVGLSWDKKLDRFFDLVGRGEHVVDWRGTSPGSCVAAIDRALADPIEPAAHAATLAQCREGIVDLADCLMQARLAA